MDVRKWLELPLEERVNLVKKSKQNGGNLLTAIDTYTSKIESTQNTFQPTEIGQEGILLFEKEVENYIELPQEGGVVNKPVNYTRRDLHTMNPTRKNFNPLKLQEDLIRLGYNLEPTGEWDDITMEALWDWQEKNAQEQPY